MKRLAWIILVICLCLACACALADPYEVVGDKLVISAEEWPGGVIPDFAGGDETPWASLRNSDIVKRIVIEAGITDIGDYAFAGFTQEDLRVEFYQSVKPEISETAFAETAAVCRHFTQGTESGYPEDGTDADYPNLTWIYMPTSELDGINLDTGKYMLNFSYRDDEIRKGWAVYVNDVEIPLSVDQAVEAAWNRHLALNLNAIPDENDEEAVICADWDQITHLSMENGCAGTLEISLGQNAVMKYVSVADADSTLTMTDTLREDGLFQMSVDNGTVEYTGKVQTLYLGYSMATGESVTINGSVATLFYDGDQAELPYLGDLTVSGKITNGYVRGNGTLAIPGAGDLVFQNMALAAFENNPQTSGITQIIEDGVLNTGIMCEETVLSTDMFRLEYGIYGAEETEASLTLYPRQEYYDLIGDNAINAFDLDIFPDKDDEDQSLRIVWGSETSFRIQNTPAGGYFDLDGITDDQGNKVGLGSVTAMGGMIRINCPVESLGVYNFASETEGLDLVVNGDVQLLVIGELNDGTVSLGTNGHIEEGVWNRKNRVTRRFGPAEYNDTENGALLAAGGTLGVVSRKEDQLIMAQLPADDAVSAAAEKTAMADVNDSSMAQMEPKGRKALNDFLQEQGQGEVAAVFDAKIIPYTEDGEGNIVTQEPITTPLKSALSFKVGNDTGEACYVLRLHNDGSDVTAEPVSACETDGTIIATADEVIPFSSDRFSKYVLVKANAPLVTEPVSYNYTDQGLCVLTISGDGALGPFDDENPLPWADHVDDIERIVIGEGITSIGANVFANLGKTVRVDFLGAAMPEIDGTAFAGTTAVCRYYTEDDSWPADSETLGEPGTVSWIYLPVYGPYTESNGEFVIFYSRPETEEEQPQGEVRWTIKDDDWVSREVSVKQAKEISYRGRNVYLEEMPSDEDYTALCDDWNTVRYLEFGYECNTGGKKTIDIPVKENPVPNIRCAGEDVTLELNVAEGGKVRLTVNGGTVTCNGDVEQLDLNAFGEDNGNVGITGDVDKLYISSAFDGKYYGTLTVGGVVGEGAVFGDADVQVDRTPGSEPMHFSHIAVATIPGFSQSTAIVSDGELHITGLENAGEWQDVYAIQYQADYSDNSWSVCLMPKGFENTYDSTYIVELADFSLDKVVYGNTNLTIENYTGAEPLQIGDEDDPTLGVFDLGVNNAKVRINCPVHSVATPYGNNSLFDISINSSVEQLWINGNDPASKVTLGEGGSVQDGFVSRPFKDQLLFGPVYGPKGGQAVKDLYSNCQAHVPYHKINQTISYLFPDNDDLSAAVGSDAVMDIDETTLSGDERELAGIGEDERISAVVDIKVWEVSDETLGEEQHDLNGHPVEIALTAPAGTRVVRLHEEGEGKERQTSATALNVDASAGDGLIRVQSDKFSKFILIDSNTWDYEYVPGEKMLRITGEGEVNVNGVAPWIYSGYDIDRVMVEDGITQIGANVFTGLKNRVRIDFCEETMPVIAAEAFGDTTAVCRYTSEDNSWNNHPVVDNVTWAWMPTFNIQGAGTFGSLWYEKDTNNPGWSVEVEADNRTYCEMTPETAHEVLLYCTDLFLSDVPATADLIKVIGNTETENWVLHIDSAYDGTLSLNGSGEGSIACAVLPRELFIYSSDAAVSVSDSRAAGIGRLEVQNGTVNYTGNIQKLVLINSGEESFAEVNVTGTIGELNYYGEGSNRPFHGRLTLTGSILEGLVYGGSVTMNIPGVYDRYPMSDSPVMAFKAALTDKTGYEVIDTSNTGDDPVVKAELEDTAAPTIDQFTLRYILGGNKNWLTLTPRADSGLGSERIEITINDGTTGYNPNFMNNLGNNIIWGNDTDVSVDLPEGYGEITLSGNDGKGINEFSATGWSTVTVQCAVNRLQLQPDPGTFGSLNLIFENKVRGAYIQPNNCDLNITLRNGGTISGGRWKQLLRDYRNFDAYRTAADETLDLVKDGALTVMSYSDGELLGAILPSDATVSDAAGKIAMATLTQMYGVESEALDHVNDGTDTPLTVEPWQIVSAFDVSVNEYTVNYKTGEASLGDPVTTQLGKTIPVTISSDEGMPNAFIVRLHDDGTVTATKLETTDLGNAKRFSSDLFSTYVLVNPDAEPDIPPAGDLSLRMAYGTADPDTGIYTGKYYYKVYIDGIGDAEQIWYGTGDPGDEEPRAVNCLASDSFDADQNGVYLLRRRSDYGPDCEALFVSLDVSGPWTKVAYEYDPDAIRDETGEDDEPIITNDDPPMLWEDYTVTWDSLEDADQYSLYWQMPNGDERSWADVNGNQLSLFDNIWYGDPSEATGYAGDYRVWIEALAGGDYVITKAKTLTVSVPQEETQQLFLSCDREDTDGVVEIPVHDKLRFKVTADEALMNDIREIRIVNGEWTEQADLLEMQRGYVSSEWVPNIEPDGGYDTYTVFAAARIGDDEETAHWIYSNPLTVHVTMNADEIAGGLVFTVENGTETEDGWTVSIPRDGMLVAHVNNIAGVAYYGAYAMEGVDQITDSRWVTAEAGGTTEVRMPLFNTGSGCTYTAYVYAIKPGAPEKVERETPIHITVTAGEDKPILLAMKDTFDVNERIRIYANYDYLWEDNQWIHVSVYPKGQEADPDSYLWDEDGDGGYYWTDALRIEEPGEYTVDAVIMQNNEDDWEHPLPVDGTRTTKDITVNETEKTLGNPVVYVTPYYAADPGDKLTLTFEAVENAETYRFAIHPDDEPERILMEGEREGAGNMTIDTSVLGGGVYCVEADVLAKGYLNGHAKTYFIVLDEGAVKTEDYCFSCNADKADPEADTDYETYIGKDLRCEYFVPGAENVKIEWRNTTKWPDDWYERISDDQQEGPGVTAWRPVDGGGVYEIYGSYRMAGDEAWTERTLLCTLFAGAEGFLDDPQAEMPTVLHAGEDLHITFYTDETIEQYQFDMSYEGRNGGWIRGETKERDELQEGAETFDFVIEAKDLVPNRAYHITLQTRARGYESGHTDRMLYIIGDQASEDVAITAPESARFSESFPISVTAPNETERIIVCWAEKDEYRTEDSNKAETWFSQDQDPGEGVTSAHFYAIAVYNENHLWLSNTVEVPYEAGAGFAGIPELSIENSVDQHENTVYQYDFIKINVGKVDGAAEYVVYLTEVGEAEWLVSDSAATAGIIALPTDGLLTGHNYYLYAYARVPGKFRTVSEPINVTIQNAESAGDHLYFNKTTVEVNEPIRVSVYAPGADSIRFSNGYGWWNDEGEAGSHWSHEYVCWDHDGKVMIRAEALRNGVWTAIGSQEITVTKRGDLDKPQILVDSMITAFENDELLITVPLVEYGEDYELEIRWVGNDDPDNLVYLNELSAGDADENDNLVFDVDAMADGIYRITCRVRTSKIGFCRSENTKEVLVNTGDTDNGITIRIDGQEPGNEPIEVLIHQRYEISVAAEGAKAILLHCGDQVRTALGDSLTEYFEENDGREGIIYAQAYYGNETVTEENLNSLDWSAPSDVVKMKFICLGRAGGAVCTVPASVKQGEFLTMTVTLGEHANEAHANISRNYSNEDEWVYGDDWQGWDERTGEIFLPTAMLEPGEYWVAVDGCGSGYDYGRSWYSFEVEANDIPESGIVIDAPESVLLGENVPVSIYAPDARQLIFKVDDEPWDMGGDIYTYQGSTWYDSHGIRWDDPEDAATGEGKEHTLTAWADFGDGFDNNKRETKIVKVCILGNLAFNLNGIPEYFNAGQTDAAMTVALPANAEAMRVAIFADGVDEPLFEEEELKIIQSITIPQEALTTGTNIHIELDAWAIGYAGAHEQLNIPVIAEGCRYGHCGKTPDDDMTWLLDENGLLTISGNGEMADYEGEEPAPWSEYSSEIRTVVIEDGVTVIGEYAFYECENLTTVTMADSVIKIWNGAFLRCAALADVQLSNGLKLIGSAAFSECPELTSITLPDGLVGIASAAFADSGISSVAVAEGVSTKGWDFFCPDKDWNKHLYHINLPDSVIDIGYGAFSYTELSYEDPDFTIPSALTTIESEAFSGTNMRFVWLPENLESIGSGAFADCPNLKYVYIPDSCRTIESGAFPAGTTVLGISGYDSPCSAETYAETNGNTFVNYEDPFAGNG